MTIIEKITEQLMQGELGYKGVSFIEEETNGTYVEMYFDVTGKRGEYEVRVSSDDNKKYEVYKENGDAYDQFEGSFELQTKSNEQ